MMLRLMLAGITGLGLGAGGAYAVGTMQRHPELTPASYLTERATIAPQRIVIGIDLSRSNPLIDDADFAAKVGARVADTIRNLGLASEVHVRTFGSYDASSNNFHYDAVLSVRNRPDYVAAEVERLLAGTPMLVRQGKWRAQGRTNILAFLDNVSQSIGCAGLPTTVILASDGIEDSEYARLEYSDARLPAPEGRPFAGCAELQILGLGVGGNSPMRTVRLRQDWSGWARAAGFRSFQGLNDW